MPEVIEFALPVLTIGVFIAVYSLIEWFIQKYGGNKNETQV